MKEKEHSSIGPKNKVSDIRGISKMDKNMEKVSRKPNIHTTKEIFSTIIKKAKVCKLLKPNAKKVTNQQTSPKSKVYTRENSVVTSEMGWVSKKHLMGNIVENGSVASNMVKADYSTQTEIFMMVTGKMVASKDKESTMRKVTASIVVSFRMENIMEQV